ncbi:hypothetical protein NDU88_001440 [Pleurodeles waltl]|uniref:Uncharacterized protein n=1 Tax=Pleurodeles waltl TaxID=8319 RepID=A0AAV7UAB0_PLEWA|nr:hypothetical protein NDU88_001440 [Pleurodeles waltl]
MGGTWSTRSRTGTPGRSPPDPPRQAPRQKKLRPAVRGERCGPKIPKQCPKQQLQTALTPAASALCLPVDDDKSEDDDRYIIAAVSSLNDASPGDDAKGGWKAAVKKDEALSQIEAFIKIGWPDKGMLQGEVMLYYGLRN